jgi:hypothetical protein
MTRASVTLPQAMSNYGWARTCLTHNKQDSVYVWGLARSHSIIYVCKSRARSCLGCCSRDRVDRVRASLERCYSTAADQSVVRAWLSSMRTSWKEHVWQHGDHLPSDIASIVCWFICVVVSWCFRFRRLFGYWYISLYIYIYILCPNT